MKNNLFLALLLLLTYGLSAQVKIGDNPNSINQNSLLELESTTKGLLAPRVALTDVASASPLTAPVPAGMIVYSTAGTVADGFYFWSGSKWLAVQSSANIRSNFVIVKSAADLPAPSGGVITLVAGTTYEVNGTVLLTSKINLNGCYLVGLDANNDKLVYTPSSGELFTGTKGGTIKTVTLASITTGSKLFNLDMGSTENLIVRDAIIVGCKDIGLVKGGNICFFSVINYSGNTSGITYQNIATLLLDNTAWFSNNAGTFEKLVGSFNLIDKLGGFSQPLSASSATAFDITGITAITDAANLKNTAFLGNGTRVNGIFSGKWEVEGAGINTEKDATATGNIYLTGVATTNFSGANVPVKVASTTMAAELFRVTAPADNRLTYTGSKSRRFSIIASMSVTAQSANKYFSFYVYKNGVLVPGSEQALRLSSGVDKGSLTISCTLQMDTNDYIEIWAANTSDATSLTIETLNLSIK
jgi:hypothetical protein